jgi:hypothetical protein
MSTDPVRCGRWAALVALCLGTWTVSAQTPAPSTPPLSSPIGPSPSAPAGKPGSPPPGLLPGSGPGFHDPRSAFKPLQEREGVVSWKLLGSVSAKVERDRVVPVFPATVRALNGQSLKVQGFMLPLEPGERQRHFLLSAVPTTCSFCVPAGPEGLVEVRTKEPIRYTVDAVTVQGTFAVLTNDKFGLFYRVADASLSP